MGYIEWIRTWSTSIFDASLAVFPVANGNYSKISIPGHAFRDNVEKEQVENLLLKLAKFDRQPFPASINREFARIAEERSAAEPLQIWLINPLKRIGHTWFTPYASFGWPGEIADPAEREKLRAMIKTGLPGAVAAFWRHPREASMKMLVAAYRYALVFFLIVAGALSVRKFPPLERTIVFLGVSYGLGRTLGMSMFAESRYISEAVPAMELAVGVAVIAFWRQRHKALQHAG